LQAKPSSYVDGCKIASGSTAKRTQMFDFDIRMMNDYGEVGVSAKTERAQHRIRQGQTLVFKSAADTRPYVNAAEAVGLIFSGKDIIGL
jgi:hypothetical protein